MSCANWCGVERRRPRTITDEKVGEVIEKTLREKPSGATHWSTTLMAKETGLNAMAVSRIWRAFGLKPHRLDTLKLSSERSRVMMATLRCFHPRLHDVHRVRGQQIDRPAQIKVHQDGAIALPPPPPAKLINP